MSDSFNDYDPSTDPALQLGLGGSLSLSLAPAVLERKRRYIECMEKLVGDVEFPMYAIPSTDERREESRSELRESFLVTTLAYLEDLSVSACEDLAMVLRVELRPSDLADRGGFERTRKYLAKVALEEAPTPPTWQKLVAYKTLRHHLAHKGRIWIDERDVKARQKLSNLIGLDFDEFGGGQLSELFCPAFMEFADTYVSELSGAARRVADRASRFRPNA